MKEGNSEMGELSELLCRSGKGPQGVEHWAESLGYSELLYLKLQQKLSSEFTPPVSKDSTTGDRAPGG